MIDATFHVELNGVKYRLADQEELRYQMRAEPLRAEAATVLQGESGKFQLRPDLLEWSINDWSGGEGLLRFSDEESNRYWISHNIDALSLPGKLRIAPNYEETKNELGGTLTESMTLGRARNGLYGARLGAKGIRKWDSTNARWGAAVSNASQVNNAAGGSAAGNARYFLYKEAGADEIWGYDDSAFSLINQDTGTGNSVKRLVYYDNYLYINRASQSGGTTGIYEIPVAGTLPTTSTLILDQTSSGNDISNKAARLLVPGNDGVFWIQKLANDVSRIWKIFPSSAAGPGYGDLLLSLSGVDIDSCWFHYGILFMGGRIGPESDPNRTRVILYLRGEEIGVLANLREEEDTTSDPILSFHGEEFDRAYFAAPYAPSGYSASTHWTVFAIDMITGGVFGLTVIPFGEDTELDSLIAFQGSVFLSKDRNATSPRVYRMLPPGSSYANTNSIPAYLDTPIHDFGLADEKILSTIRLVTEPLPSGTSVEIQYQLDQNGIWESAGVYNTTNGTGTEFVVSSSISTKTFRNLQLRIKLSNGGDTTKTPVVLQVSTRATVSRTLKVWRLALALMDEGRAQDRSRSGEHQIANITTAGDSGTIVEFKDGAISRRAGVFNTHNVIIDSYSIEMNRPGEGTALVVLREVV